MSGRVWTDQAKGAHTMDDHADLVSELIDVSTLSLDQIDALPDSVLRASLTRILRENAEMPSQYAAFQSSL